METVCSQAFTEKWPGARCRLVLTLMANAHRITNFRPALGLQGRPGSWGDRN